MEIATKNLNYYLVKNFNDLLKIEENCLNHLGIGDLSMREIHIIEEVCYAFSQRTSNASSAIATLQRITPSTLTTSVKVLEKKGYLIRKKDEVDKRIIRLVPTEKAITIDQLHTNFHREMIQSLEKELSSKELEILIQSLNNIHYFFSEKYHITLNKGGKYGN